MTKFERKMTKLSEKQQKSQERQSKVNAKVLCGFRARKMTKQSIEKIKSEAAFSRVFRNKVGTGYCIMVGPGICRPQPFGGRTIRVLPMPMNKFALDLLPALGVPTPFGAKMRVDQVMMGCSPGKCTGPEPYQCTKCPKGTVRMETNPRTKSGYCVAFPARAQARLPDWGSRKAKLRRRNQADREAEDVIRTKLWSGAAPDFVGASPTQRKWACLTGCFPRQFWKLLKGIDRFTCTKLCSAMPTAWPRQLGGPLNAKPCIMRKQIACQAFKRHAGCQGMSSNQSAGNSTGLVCPKWSCSQSKAAVGAPNPACDQLLSIM